MPHEPVRDIQSYMTEPVAMPMWRGYSVLEKDDHTVRGGTISAGAAQDAGATRTGSPNTAGGYGCKTVKQEINLAPTHLGGPRFGRRKSSVTEQLAEGMEEIGKARGRLSQRSQEIKQNRRESFGRLLTMPKAPGWLSAERNYRRTSSSSSTELRQQTKPKTPTREEVEREERRASAPSAPRPMEEPIIIVEGSLRQRSSEIMSGGCTNERSSRGRGAPAVVGADAGVGRCMHVLSQRLSSLAGLCFCVPVCSRRKERGTDSHRKGKGQ